MTVIFNLLLVALLVLAGLAIFLTLPAARLGKFLNLAMPAVLLLGGGFLALVGRPSVGMAIAGLGVTWFLAKRRPTPAGTVAGRRSTVRSAMFEMQLDHDSGELDGLVLTGAHEGKWLSDLDEQALLQLHSAAIGERDSGGLLEAYLDRRIAHWRENTKPHGDMGQRSSVGSGTMTKQEAYQVLGLDAGSGPEQIRQAHRRLMKAMHPDSGGSTFLASKINEAKDILLK